MTEEGSEKTIVLSAPYDREAVRAAVLELNEQPHDVLVGLVMVVDHSPPQRVWVIATVDTATDAGPALCDWLGAIPGLTPSHAMTIERAFELLARGECNLVLFSGTALDEESFNTAWPA